MIVFKIERQRGESVSHELEVTSHVTSQTVIGEFPKDSIARKWYSKLTELPLERPLNLDFQEHDCPFCFEGSRRRKVLTASPRGIKPSRGNATFFKEFLLSDRTNTLITECEQRSTLDCFGSKTKFTPLFCNAESCIIRLFKKWIRNGVKIFDTLNKGGSPSIEASRKASITSGVVFPKGTRNFKVSHNRSLVRRMKSVNDLQHAFPDEQDPPFEQNDRVFRSEQQDNSRRYIRGTIIAYWLNKVQQQVVTSQPFSDAYCPFCFSTDGSGRVALTESRKALSVLSFAKFVNEDKTGILRDECSRRGTIAAFRNLGINRSFLDFCNQRWCLKRVFRSYHRRKIADPDLDFFRMRKLYDAKYSGYDVMTLLNGTTIASNRDLAKVRLPIDKDKVDVRYIDLADIEYSLMF